MEAELGLEVAADTRAAAEAAAARIAATARAAVADRGEFHLAVSGGRTPWLMLAVLATADMPWERTTVHQVDERIASPGSPDRNLTHLVLTLPIDKQAAIRPMPVTRRNLEEAAEEYADGLPQRLDLVHLGLGLDGHTASLVPDDPVLEVSDRRVALTAGSYRGHRRMTLTFPVINAARSILWLVTGDEKEPQLKRLLSGDAGIPAGRVRREDAAVVCDFSAAGRERTMQPLDSDQPA